MIISTWPTLSHIIVKTTLKENKKSFGQPGKKVVTNKEKKTRLSLDFSTILNTPQKKGVTNLRHPSKGNMNSATGIYLS